MFTFSCAAHSSYSSHKYPQKVLYIILYTCIWINIYDAEYALYIWGTNVGTGTLNNLPRSYSFIYTWGSLDLNLHLFDFRLSLYLPTLLPPVSQQPPPTLNNMGWKACLINVHAFLLPLPRACPRVVIRECLLNESLILPPTRGTLCPSRTTLFLSFNHFYWTQRSSGGKESSSPPGDN